MRPSLLADAQLRESILPINLLTSLELDELSLVDNPANQMAIAPIFKRDTSNGEEMTKETEIDTEAMKADVAKYKAENERLRKALIDNGFVIEADKVAKKAPVETIEVDGEKINKADIPAAILKKMEADEASIAKAAVEKADRELTEKAKETLPNFDENVAKSLMKSLDGVEDYDKIMEALKAADKAFDAKMEELGKADVDGSMSDPKTKMETLTKAYKEAHKVSYENAYAEVAKTKEGSALITAIYKSEKE